MNAWTFGNGQTELIYHDLSAYEIPKGTVHPFFKHLLTVDGGVLIAGTTGSGKSVLLHGIITTILRSFAPSAVGGKDSCSLYLIDPKIVELSCYESLPHVAGYASDFDDIVALLQAINEMMMSRYKAMHARGIRKWDGPRAFVFIDEIGDLMILKKREVFPILTHLINLCRAAGITVFLATQSPSRQTIPAAAQINCTCKIALRCATAIESRQTVDVDGAEKLPKHGKALVKCDWMEGIQTVDLPYIDEKEQTETLRAVIQAEQATLRRKYVSA